MSAPTGAEFFARLLEALTDAGLPTTQTEIGAMCGVNQSAVAKWKSSESFPTYENALRLAQRARVSLSWLWLGLGNKNNGGDMDEQTVALLDAWHRLPEAVRREILEYIRFRSQADSAPLPERDPKH
jgi:transcriptional regulator with XRE-family HTH domain